MLSLDPEVEGAHNLIITCGMTLQVYVFQCRACCGDTVPAGHARSRAALSGGNVCGAKPSRIPLVELGFVKFAECGSAFIFCIFKIPPMWGILFFFIIIFSLATARFNFYIKH